jgi:hypothetical protein
VLRARPSRRRARIRFVGTPRRERAGDLRTFKSTFER